VRQSTATKGKDGKPRGGWSQKTFDRYLKKLVEQLEFALRAQKHRIEEQQVRIEALLAENQRLVNSQLAVANGQGSNTAVDILLGIMGNPDIIMRRRISRRVS
jgi:hypothetical protein